MRLVLVGWFCGGNEHIYRVCLLSYLAAGYLQWWRCLYRTGLFNISRQKGIWWRLAGDRASLSAVLHQSCGYIHI